MAVALCVLQLTLRTQRFSPCDDLSRISKCVLAQLIEEKLVKLFEEDMISSCHTTGLHSLEDNALEVVESYHCLFPPEFRWVAEPGTFATEFWEVTVRW